MDNNGIIGEILESGQNTTKNAVSDVTRSVKSQVGVQGGNKPVPSSDGFKGAIKNQVGVSDTKPTGSSDGFTDVVKDQIGIANEKGAALKTNSSQNQTSSDSQQKQADIQKQTNEQERTKEVVGEFYEKSDNSNVKAQTQEQITTQKQLVKTREELSKFQNLHKETYYEPLVAYETKQPHQEESAVERVEKQEMQDLEEKNEKQKNMQPIAVARAKIAVEANRGVSG